MDTPTVLSVVASIVSVIIGGFAIWLAVTFYRLSNDSARQTREAADEIKGSVSRLESLFDKMYSDTFSMVKDTVSDMRRQLWPTSGDDADRISDEIERRVAEKSKHLKTELASEFSTLLADQNADTIDRNELDELIERAVAKSREIQSESIEETLEESLRLKIATLRDRDGLKVSDLVFPLMDNWKPTEILDGMSELRSQGLLDFEGDYPDVDGHLGIA